MNNAKTIFENVLAAMQDAEEISGPEGADYVALMDQIASEARTRAVNARANLGLSAEPPVELNEDEKTRRGLMLASVLRLKLQHSGMRQHVYGTEWGTKTAYGLFATCQRIIQDGK